MNYQSRIKETLERSDEYIAYLARFADHKLERKLNTVQQQIAIARQNKLDEPLHLLLIWERQIIEARILKYDQHPPLDELTDLEKGLAEMEAMERMMEKRQKVLKQKMEPQAPIESIRDEQILEEKSTIAVITQMKLF